MTEFGIITEVSFEQLWNTLPPIVVTKLGIVMEVRPEFENALSLIVVTKSEIIMEVRFVQ